MKGFKKSIELFTCFSCQCEVSIELCMRTPGYCYLCDPDITLDELLSNDHLNPSPEINSLTLKNDEDGISSQA